MGKVRSIAVVWAMVIVGVMASGCSAQVKEPNVAGAFYPAGKEELVSKVDGYLAGASVSAVDGRLLALVAPHAGYEFSGSVAGYAYAALKGREIDTVILIGPSHHSSFTGAAVYTGNGMRTPLGVVKVDGKVAASLIDDKAGVAANPAPFEKEHSLEVQLPFLQRTLKHFTVVPVLIGNPSRESFLSLTEKLSALLRGNERVLIVASTDLSHYHDGKTAGEMDRRVIDAVERLATGDLESLLMHRKGEMCGGFPVIYTLGAVRSVGATGGRLFRYADSGDVTGDKKSVVGYAAMGLYRSSLSPEEKQEILALAKDTLKAHLEGKKIPEATPRSSRLKADGAVFVTLNDKRGNLRGCIGNIEPTMPLYRAVMMNAMSAATRDPRFPPVRQEELPDLHVEVTVLSPLVELPDVGNIRIGTHGLFLQKGMNSGVFLPQVPVEQKWDTPTYLEQLALKAGLPKEGWKGGKLYSFTADIIK